MGTSGVLALTILTFFAPNAMTQEIATVDKHDPQKELGKLVVQLFTPDQFDAAPIVRSIVQTPDGLVYAATSAGVAEFDGVLWRLIEHPGVPLSLAVNDAGTVYVGYQSDFGQLVADASGQLTFQSLKDFAPEGTRVRDIRMIATAGSHADFSRSTTCFSGTGNRTR